METEFSSKGLFAVGTAGFGPASAARKMAHRKRLRAIRVNRMLQLADLMADGLSVSAAARRLGVSQQCGSSMFREICSLLGDQSK